MNEKEYLEKCKELLEYFGKDLSSDIILCHSGDNSCILNSSSQFYQLFAGSSIYAIAEYYANKTKKKIKYNE